MLGNGPFSVGQMWDLFLHVQRHAKVTLTPNRNLTLTLTPILTLTLPDTTPNPNHDPKPLILTVSPNNKSLNLALTQILSL